MAKPYKVERKDPRIKFKPTDEQYTVYRIWATTAGGTLFPLEVKEEDLDRAEELLTREALKLDAIK